MLDIRVMDLKLLTFKAGMCNKWSFSLQQIPDLKVMVPCSSMHQNGLHVTENVVSSQGEERYRHAHGKGQVVLGAKCLLWTDVCKIW